MAFLFGRRCRYQTICLILAAIIQSASCFSLLGSRRSLLASLVSTASFSQQDLIKSLKPATDDQPQIQFPDAIQQQSYVEGLISLASPSTKRPNPTDILYITATIADSKDSSVTTILAGAAVPVSRLSFPFRFQLSADNALASRRKDMVRALNNNDIVVVGKVCSSNDDESMATSVGNTSIFQACSATLQGTGVAKLLRLPQGTVRAPVRLILE